MRKYIHLAKAVTPVLTEEAANHIAEEYSRLRSQEQMGADIARVSRKTDTHTHTHGHTLILSRFILFLQVLGTSLFCQCVHKMFLQLSRCS